MCVVKQLLYTYWMTSGGQGSMAVNGGRGQMTRAWNCFMWMFNVDVIL